MDDTASSSAAPPSPPSSGPAPVPVPTAPSACSTPDPFAGPGGGTCYDGGWLPLGMVQAAPAGPEVVVTGTLHVLSAAEPLWLLAGDDGVLYTSMTDVPADMLIDGLRVTVVGLMLSEWPEEGQAELEILVLTIDLHLD